MNPDFHTRLEHILGHQWSTKMASDDINQGKHFIYCHLIHALMSTSDLMSFKISSIGIRAIHGWHLSCIFGLFWVSVFWFGSHFLEFFFHLVLILGFQARLMLETCRKYCLEQNIFFLFYGFWSSFDGISKIRAYFGSSFYAFFV